MKSGSAFEALAVDVCGFSVAPCVQHREAPDAAIVSCCRLHEAGVAVALRGPLPELLRVVRRGFPLKVGGLVSAAVAAAAAAVCTSCAVQLLLLMMMVMVTMSF